MTKITIDEYILNELMELKEHEVLEVYDDNGTLGYLEKTQEGDIEILGRHFAFNYYCPTLVRIYQFTDKTLTNKKRIGGN